MTLADTPSARYMRRKRAAMTADELKAHRLKQAEYRRRPGHREYMKAKNAAHWAANREALIARRLERKPAAPETCLVCGRPRDAVDSKSKGYKVCRSCRFDAAAGEPDGNGCQTWTGRFAKGLIPKLGGEQARRYVWEREHGPIPTGYIVHRHCDNPRCVAVDHLEAMPRNDHMRHRRSRIEPGSWTTRGHNGRAAWVEYRRRVLPELFARQSGVCPVCDKPLDREAPSLSREGLTVDHVVPLALGGDLIPADISGVRLLHRGCNSSEYFRLRRERDPQAPLVLFEL